jgi:hypothetical protein
VPGQINIPVSVTGAQEAKQELQAVGQAAASAQQQAAAAKKESQAAAPEQPAAGAAGLAEDAEQSKRAASATEQLIEKKRSLANVVRMVGGQFGSEVGELGSLVSLLLTANPAVMGVAAALAALAIGVKVFGDLKRAAEEAAAAQREYNAAVAEGQAQKRTATQGIAQELERFGARSEENIKAATQTRDRLRKDLGVPVEQGTKVGVLAAGAGLGTEDAERLSVLIGAGARIESPEEAKKALAQAQQAGKSDLLLAEAKRHAMDQAAIAERVKARAPAASGTGEASPEALAFQALKEQPGGPGASGFPKELTFEQFQDVLAAKEASVKAIAREMYPGKKLLTGGEYARAQQAAEGATGAARKLVQQARGLGEPGTPAPTLTPAAGPSEAGREVQHIVNNYNTTNNLNVNSMYGVGGGGPSEKLFAWELEQGGGNE